MTWHFLWNKCWSLRRSAILTLCGRSRTWVRISQSVSVGMHVIPLAGGKKQQVARTSINWTHCFHSCFVYCSNLLMLGWKSFVWLVFDGIHRCPIWPVVAVCCVYLGNCRYPPSADSSCDRPTIPDNDWLVFLGKRPQVINKVLRWFSTLFQLTWILGRFIKQLPD